MNVATIWHGRGHGRPRSQADEGRVRQLRTPLLVLAGALALVLVIRLILDPLASHETRKTLDGLDGFRGAFERVHVTVLSPGYEITRLKLTPSGASRELSSTVPIFYVEHARLGLSWRELLHGRLAVVLRLDEPKVNILPRPSPKMTRTATKTATKAPDLSDQLQRAIAVRVERCEVFAGEVTFREGPGPHPRELWVHRLELTAQNLATRASGAGGRPATVSAHGVLGQTGELTLFVSADPLASPLNFAGQVSLLGLRASELYAFVEPKAHLQVEHGTIDVFAEFISKNGMLTGGIKPVLKNIQVGPTEAGLGNRLKAWLADKSVEIASDRVPGRNAVATTIPIKGKLTDPELQLWPTVFGIIRNAYVEGLVSGFANVPPETADNKETVLTQAKNALKNDHGPPKAQPVKP